MDDNQRSNVPTVIESVNAAPVIPDRCNVFNIKEELGDSELDLKPRLYDYTSNQNVSVAKEENTIADDGDGPILCNREKEESLEDEWRAAQHSEETQPDQRAQFQLTRCDKCLKTFRRKGALNVHCIRVHGTASHECTECNLKFKCAEYLVRHVRNVHSKQQYECTGCNKMCKSKQALYYHVTRCRELRSAVAQHTEETQPEQRAQSRLYRCDKCPNTYKSNNSLRMHCRCVHGTGSHECTECNLKYKCREYLVRHIRNVHSKQQYECTGCKKMCKSKQALLRHVPWCRDLRPAGSELRNYVCDYCQKTYKAKQHVQLHIASVHANRMYKCSQCNKSFKCKQYVTNHTAKMHSAGMRECNICGKSVRPHYLRGHMLMHCDEQVQCKLCAEVMKLKQYLHQHLKDCNGQQSAGSRQHFTCCNCGKNFTSKRNCQKHEISCKCTLPTASNTSAVASTSTQQHSVVIVKEDPADVELELGPVVFQHMDSNYRPYKQEPQLD